MNAKELKLLLTGLSVAGLVAGCSPANHQPVSSPTPGSIPISISPSG